MEVKALNRPAGRVPGGHGCQAFSGPGVAVEFPPATP
jgi:hypothetical protein